ncbi:MAG: type IIL restriction-modification enzyme MmeI, partial [Methylocystis sp.]
WSSFFVIAKARKNQIPTPFLTRESRHDSQKSSRNRKIFRLSVLLGMGFTFDNVNNKKGKSSSLAEMDQLIKLNAKNKERIFPFIGGEEVNNEPTAACHRYAFNLSDLSEEEAERQYPDLFEIARLRVKPQRESVKRDSYRSNWWRFAEPQAALYRTIEPIPRVLATNCGASPHLGFAFLPKDMIYAHTLTILAFSKFSPFAILQSRVHEAWARFFSSSMKDDLRYTPSDCFRTFPFPADFVADSTLESNGEAYHAFRAQLMIDRNEGLTKTYNRFHARGENSVDIARLRALHAEMDAAVLRAYGWDDLADRATPEFIEQDADEGKTPKTRLDWPTEFKDEVLAHLLALNAERAAAELAAGLTVPAEEDEDLVEVDD